MSTQVVTHLGEHGPFQGVLVYRHHLRLHPGRMAYLAGTHAPLEGGVGDNFISGTAHYAYLPVATVITGLCTILPRRRTARRGNTDIAPYCCVKIVAR